MSETVLHDSRMNDELDLDSSLTSDEVIAAPRETIEETVRYIEEKYTSAYGYMREVSRPFSMLSAKKCTSYKSAVASID